MLVYVCVCVGGCVGVCGGVCDACILHVAHVCGNNDDAPSSNRRKR